MRIPFYATPSGFAAAFLLWPASLQGATTPDAATAAAPQIQWQEWSEKAFAEARAEHRFVLLDLGAGWCHWCHVMDEITYADPEVAALIRAKYVAVRVDQDARPDLANRYEDYGWPATIVFNVDGSEIVKRRGYIPPKPMASMLQAIIDDPSPGPSIVAEAPVVPSKEPGLTPEQRRSTRETFLAAYDAKVGGWGEVHKFLDWNALEYCMVEGASGDARMKEMAEQTLKAGRKLIDPVWGGVYQYSTDGDWDHPHFEKIMPFQAENLRVLALADTLMPNPEWMQAAERIRSFLKNFLSSPAGAFYASEDADIIPGEYAEKYFALDDAGRRRQGIPRIDTHIFARENGLAATGLAALSAAGGEAAAVEEARRSWEWTAEKMSVPGGGFRHTAEANDQLYLADTLAMGRAALALYAATAEREWLPKAVAAARFMGGHFSDDAGFVTAERTEGIRGAAKAEADENVMLARFCRRLAAYTGDAEIAEMARHAMRYLAAPEVVKEQGPAAAGILLADREMGREPVHITVAGAKTDPAARALFAEARKAAVGYARVEWYDPAEGPLPHNDVELPVAATATAFLCEGKSCSAPMHAAQEVAAKLRSTGFGARK